MLKNYLVIALRNILKLKIFLLINTIGLGVAISCSIIAYLNWDFNDEFDSIHKNSTNVFRINAIGGNEGQDQEIRIGTVPLPLGEAIYSNYKGISLVKCIVEKSNVLIGNDFFPISMNYVDKDFFNFFSFNFIEGSSKDISDKSKIFIREDISKKYFGTDAAIGKLLTLFSKNEPREYVIAGVFKKQPDNSSFSSLEAILSYENYFITYKDLSENDWSHWNTTFVKGKNIEYLDSYLSRYVEVQNNASDFKIKNYYLEPFLEMAKNAEKYSIQNHWFRSSLPIAGVIGPSILAIFMILIACFNFTNTIIAMSGRRLKEIGIRKTLGGNRWGLISQFFIESFIFSFISFLLGLLFSEVLVPKYNEMWQYVHLEVTYSLSFFLFAIFMLLLVSLLAGGYPAIYISKYQPIEILRGKIRFKVDNYFVNFLLILQLSISVAAIIASIAFIRNANFQSSLDYGFNIDNIIYVRLEESNKWPAYSNSLSNYPNISIVSGAKHHIKTMISSGVARLNNTKNDCQYFEIGDNYLDAMGLKLIEGRKFKINSETDLLNSIIVNETFLKTFEVKNPSDLDVIWNDTLKLKIVGVVKDFYGGAFKEPIKPTVFKMVKESEFSFLIVKTNKHDLKSVMEFMSLKWKELFPYQYFQGVAMENDFAGPSIVNQNILITFLFLGFLTTLLSASGVFNIVSFNIFDKTKEIGIRKIFGSTITEIVLTINKKYIILFSLSTITGSILGGAMINFLLNLIWTYHSDVNYVVFFLSIFIMASVIIITISGKILEITKINPSQALRTE
jgi:ABC-type antimicrobial peptide transport system permease subunit